MIREMENRYHLLHDKGVRNLDSYNRLIADGVAAAVKARDEDRAEEGLEAEDPPFDFDAKLGST